MTKHGGHEWKARGHKCSLDLELLITLSWIPHLSFKKLKRLITVVDILSEKTASWWNVISNDFLHLLQMCSEFENGNISDPSKP